MPIKGCNVQVWIIPKQLQCECYDVHNHRFPHNNSSAFRVSSDQQKTLQVMTEIDLISKMIGKTPKTVQCPEYLLLFNMIIGNTFFINRFPNMINAIGTTVQYTGYSWASFTSFVLFVQCSPTHTSLSKHSVYTLQNFVSKCHNIVNTLPLLGTG